jgi:hypothetical protein
MADVQSISVFDVECITISKNERDGHKWISIDLGGGSSIAVFQSAYSKDWPEVFFQHHTITVTMEEEPQTLDEPDPIA